MFPKQTMPDKRCLQCRLKIQLCLCHNFSAHWIKHKITLLTSRKEEFIPSNTGRLLKLMLKNITCIYLGENGWEKKVESEISKTNYTHATLFPIASASYAHSVSEKTGKPLNIFVMDTSWKNGRRWIRKPLFLNLQKIRLQTIPPSEYHLRKQYDKNYLCTFQAVASLMSELKIDNAHSVTSQLNTNFKLWVKSLANERGLTLPRAIYSR